MSKLRRLSLLAALAGVLAPSTASAATWVESLTTNPDPGVSGGIYLHQDFIVTGGGMKVQGLAYHADTEQGDAIRYARRAVEWGVPLEEGEWEFSDADYSSTYDDALLHPHLALDRATGTPYIAYVGNSGYAADRLELSSFVGDGNGNCGKDFDWHCDTVLTACGMQLEELGGGSSARPRLELESVFGEAADAAHVMFQIKGEQPGDAPRLVHARKDFTSQGWACQILPGTGLRNNTLMESTSIFHGFDGRLKPMLTHAVRRRSNSQFRQVIRSLIDYVGTPLPPMSWTEEFEVASPQGHAYNTPALEIRDEGFGPEGYAMPSGIGLPAIAEAYASDSSITPWPYCDANPGSWSLEYRVATDEAATGWGPAESVTTGRPCGPSMAFGWEMTPHILYADDTDLMLTARRPQGRQLWTTPVPIVSNPPTEVLMNTDIIFDPDFGTISVVYVKSLPGNTYDIAVVDGYLE